MKFECCAKDHLETLNKELDCKCEETKDGIKLEISPKDPSKTQALKDLFNGLKQFIHCDCCK